MKLIIDNQLVGLAELREAWRHPITVGLGNEARRAVAKSNELINDVLASGEQVYGVNTGFGQFAQVRVSDEDLAVLQENLVRSHSVGVGNDLDDNIVRLIMLMKVIALAEGFSGVRVELIDALCALINHDIYPRIPEKGSVGASGDLAPLAHMAGVLIGVGEARVNGTKVPAQVALAEAGLEPIVLAPKEGLALLNGTQVSTALGLAAAFRTENVLSAALAAGAMSSDAIKASDTPFDKRLQSVRGHGCQIAVAGVLRALMQDSEIRASHVDCDRVQDPYSIRCQPQVAGACLDVLRHVCKVIETESNAVTDNPLVFADSRAVLSGGNFHAEPIAMAADNLALAIAEIGALAERRTALLIDAKLSRLPPFLVDNGGVNSGFMIVQYTAAALVSENKVLAHPASVDSIPTSANKEDHVSMGTIAARKAGQVLENVKQVAAIELLCAAQALDLFTNLKPGKGSLAAYKVVRRHVKPMKRDRELAPDIATVAALIDNDEILKAVEKTSGPLL